MYYATVLAALAGFGSLVAAAPAHKNAHKNRHVVERANNNNDNKNGNNNNNNNNNGGSIVNISPAQLLGGNTVIIEQTVVQPQITIIQENLDLVNQLALAAEQEFSALVQSQLALVNEVETIKNNIRVNHFQARFSQVNTVIVCVTQLVDLRGGNNGRNSRYMINQLLADNGKAASTVVVMLTAANPVTINAAQPTLDLSGLLGANSSALPTGVVASVVAAASASAAAAAASGVAVSNSTSTNNGTLQVAAFDPNNPFGQIGQTIILPYGSKAPSLPNGAQVVADPASIILPNQRGLLVEDVNQLSQDCSLFSSNGLSLFNLQSAVLQEAAAIAALEVSGLSLGSASTLNSAAAALLGGAAGSIVNIGSASVSSTTTTAEAASVAAAAAATTVATTSAAVAAAPAVASTSAAAVAAGAAVVSSAAPAAAAPAASAASGASGGVGVQIVAIPAAA
ncbi:hypothetical protein SBRCBS47491_001434 [Sporothrix bragantina]|uniref:Uncharacterized protein n=1 Tax=Sporothrix bragantina TaxID=671064 RepID=A0ABP0AYK9_9PEZI